MAQDTDPILITGCSTGIGRETARHLASRGHRVFATARKLEAIEDLKEAGCETLACDVNSEESMTACVNAVEEAEGAVGALVNNAGYSQSGAVETVPIDSVRRQFETNVYGLMRMCQLVLPKMRERGEGRIVNVSSMGGKLVFPGGGVYHATKHAVEAISDALRWEVEKFGIEVVIIEPGLIKTDFADTAVGSISETETEGPSRASTTLSARSRPVPTAVRPRSSAAGRTPSRARSRRRSRRGARDALQGHTLGGPDHGPAPDPQRPDVGPLREDAVPAARPLSRTRLRPRRCRRSGRGSAADSR